MAISFAILEKSRARVILSQAKRARYIVVCIDPRLHPIKYTVNLRTFPETIKTRVGVIAPLLKNQIYGFFMLRNSQNRK